MLCALLPQACLLSTLQESLCSTVHLQQAVSEVSRAFASRDVCNSMLFGGFNV